MNIHFQKIKRIGLNSGNKIFGIPLNFVDRLTEIVKFDPLTKNIQDSGLIYSNITSNGAVSSFKI